MKTFLALNLTLALAAAASAADPPRPNILWLSSEDHGPEMGCYGDSYATTPNIDALAAKGMLYLHCWSNAPVCAPARTTIISGLYPTSTGAEDMRSMVPYPEGLRMFPHYLRQAGYYCTNNSKEDYNLPKQGQVWDESSGRAHYKNREEGQPFFAVFNSTVSHESQVRKRPHTLQHDPAEAPIPAYHPDTPEVRRDWAQYYDKVTAADAEAGEHLRELEQSGLAEDTIVFYWGDHGSGMPRSKRWPSNSGLHVPLVVFIPEKFKALRPPEYEAGGKSERLVGFIDFAPTMLSLVGVQPPEKMQGHAFLGVHTAQQQPFLYGFRGRMDERRDLVRSVTDGRYVYLRNYMPHFSQAQHVSYQFETPTTAVWRTLYDKGQLNEAQSIFWETPKSPEELYDLHRDPDEVNNLADSPEHQSILKEFRRAHREHVFQIRDIGFMPEGERLQRADGDSLYALGHDPQRYPLERVFAAADLASSLNMEATDQLIELLGDEHSTVRYWGAMGLLMRGTRAVVQASAPLQRAMADDASPYVRIAAAHALAQYGRVSDVQPALEILVGLADWNEHDVFTVMAALTALDALDAKAAPVADRIGALPEKGPAPDRRYDSYIPRLLAGLRDEYGRS